MATANANATVAYARRRARHGKNPVYVRYAKWDFSSQNIAKSGTAEVLNIPAGTYILGGKLKISTALTSSATVTVKVGATAFTGAVAKSAATTVLGTAYAASLANTVFHTASADTVDLVAGSAAAIAAGVAELEVICLDSNMK